MYLKIALMVSEQSYAERLKVGAVFVSSEGIISIGINGLPPNGSNVCESNGKTLPQVSHAEENLFAKIMRQGISTINGTMFITHSPCINCAKIILGADIKELYYTSDYRCDSGINWLRSNGVCVFKREIY